MHSHAAILSSVYGDESMSQRRLQSQQGLQKGVHAPQGVISEDAATEGSMTYKNRH